MAPVDTATVIDILAHPADHRTIRYEISEKEFLAGSSLHPGARKRVRIGTIYGALVFLVAGWMYSVGATYFAAFTAVLAVACPLIIKLILLIGSRKSFRSMRPILGAPVEILYGPGFIAQKTTSTFSYLTWLYQITGNKYFRLLGTSSNVFIVVPVRAFENPMALAEFDSVVAEMAEHRVTIRK